MHTHKFTYFTQHKPFVCNLVSAGFSPTTKHETFLIKTVMMRRHSFSLLFIKLKIYCKFLFFNLREICIYPLN